MLSTSDLPCHDEFTPVLIRDAERALDLFEEIAGHSISGAEILDIGAHHGTFALAACARGARRVACIEASLDNLTALETNIPAVLGYGGGARVLIMHAAAWEGPARDLTLYKTRGTNSGQFSVCFDPARYPVAEQVRTIAFSYLLSGWGHAPERWDYVKVDVEGAEWSWLNGPTAAAASVPHFRYLDIELHPLSNGEYYATQPGEALTLSDVDQWFRAAGCRIVWREESPTRLFIVAP